MALKTVKLYATACAELNYNAPDTNNHTLTQARGNDILLKFDPPQDMLYGKIVYVTLYLYVNGKIYSDEPSYTQFCAVRSEWDPNTVTYNTRPSVLFSQKGSALYYSSPKYESVGHFGDEAGAAYAIRYGVQVGYPTSDYKYYTANAASQYRPYLEVDYFEGPSSQYGPFIKMTKPEAKDSNGWFYYIMTEYERTELMWFELYTVGNAQIPFLVGPKLSSVSLMRENTAVKTWSPLGSQSTVQKLFLDFPQGIILPDVGPWGYMETTAQAVTQDGVTLTTALFDKEKYGMGQIQPKPNRYGTPQHPAYLDRTQEYRMPIPTEQYGGYQKGDYEMPELHFVNMTTCTATWRLIDGVETHPLTVEKTVIAELEGGRTVNKWTLVIPENTLPARSDIIIHIEATSEYGNVWTSVANVDGNLIELTYTTKEEQSTCTAISPDGIPVDTSKGTEFRWRHSIVTGTQQTAADLQYSTDGETWTDLANVVGAANSCVVPGGTLPAGTVYWRARTYNTDAVASEWSNVLSFISVRAPDPPSVYVVDSSPRPIIQWAGTGQEAYELYVGAYGSGIQYGQETSWQAPVFFSPGDYIVRVRIQNEYGLWSGFGETILTVVNTPLGDLTLAAELDGDQDVLLTWNLLQNAEYYVVYRNGRPIATVRTSMYEDSGAVGTCEYIVRAGTSLSGDYSESNTVTVTVTPTDIIIKADGSSSWVKLKYAETAVREYVKTASATGTTYHVTGREHPVAALTEYRTHILQITAAFKHGDPDADALEAMLGKIVVLKTPRLEMVRGPLLSFDRKTNQFYKAYAFSVTNTEEEEETLGS